MAPALEVGEPLAGGKEQENDDGRGEVHDREFEAGSGRWLGAGIAVEPVGAIEANEIDRDGEPVNEGEVQEAVKQRHSSEDAKRTEKLGARAVEPGKQQRGGTQGHEQVTERGRSFGAVEHGQNGAKPGGLRCPRSGITVEIRKTKEEKDDDQIEPDPPEPARAIGRFSEQDGSKRVAGGHDADPGNERIGCLKT